MAAQRKIDYQALTDELEAVITKLSDEDTSIEDSLKLFERGLALTKEIEDYLKHAENRLKKIAPETEAIS